MLQMDKLAEEPRACLERPASDACTHALTTLSTACTLRHERTIY